MLSLNKDLRILVLDTSAFIAGFDPQSIDSLQYSVPAVKNELIPDSLPWIRFNTAVENRKLRVKFPLKKSIAQARTASKHTGDFKFLSAADLQVLALATESRDLTDQLYIVTDDYSIQNVADQLKIKFSSLATFGITHHITWTLYCPACHRTYITDHSPKCDICETKLRRKPSKRAELEKSL